MVAARSRLSAAVPKGRSRCGQRLNTRLSPDPIKGPLLGRRVTPPVVRLIGRATGSEDFGRARAAWAAGSSRTLRAPIPNGYEGVQ